MIKTANDRSQTADEEREIENALILQASEASTAIRRRLAIVADDLHRAAVSTGSENLLQLARKFELHAKAEDAA